MRKTNSKKSKRIAKTGNRILSVVIRRMYDESPDTSWMGEYSNTPDSEFSIDRAHAEDCASVTPEAQRAHDILEHAQQTVGDLHNAVLAEYNGTLANEELDRERDALDEAYNLLGELSDEVIECDCGEHGDMERHEYRYFNPSFNYIGKDGQPADGLTPEEVRKYTRQDYERMESLHRGDWGFIGIRAEAEIAIPSGPQSATVQKITSGGLWGIESDSDEACFTETEQDELSDLREQLTALGFSRRAISVAFKNVEHKREVTGGLRWNSIEEVAYMEWKIFGTYRGEREEIDTAETWKEAHFMVKEYRLAFGPEWIITVKRSRKKS